MKNFIIIIIGSILLAGCATVTKTYGPDGKQAFSLNCSGNARSWDACYRAAGDICGSRGYTTLSQTSEGVANASFTSGGFFASKSNERTMLIECR